jgi:hypothetical protein
MALSGTGIVQVRTAGAVPARMPELARRRMSRVLRHISEPVLFARVMLRMAADPAVERPAAAWAMVSVNGRLVQASATGRTMPDAIGQLTSRLRIRLDRAWPDQRGHLRGRRGPGGYGAGAAAMRA